MARSQQTFNKKELEKKKQQRRKEKEEKREERKGKKGKSFEEMIAYVDEFGNFSSTPPDPTKRTELNVEEIQLGARRDDTPAADTRRSGTVTHYNDQKGYGFIKEPGSAESVFFHVNGVTAPVGEGDAVTFEVERGPKGLQAVNVSPA